MNSAATKIVLVPASLPARGEPRVRRFRLARLALNPAGDPAECRFEHLKRTYD